MVKYFRVKKDNFSDFKYCYEKFQPNMRVDVVDDADYGYYRVKVVKQYNKKSESPGIPTRIGERFRESFERSAREFVDSAPSWSTIRSTDQGEPSDEIRVRWGRDDEGHITANPEHNVPPETIAPVIVNCADCGGTYHTDLSDGCPNCHSHSITEHETSEPEPVECECGCRYQGNVFNSCPNCHSNVVRGEPRDPPEVIGVLEENELPPISHRCRGCGYIHRPRTDRICPRCHCNIGNGEVTTEWRVINCIHCGRANEIGGNPSTWRCSECRAYNYENVQETTETHENEEINDHTLRCTDCGNIYNLIDGGCPCRGERTEPVTDNRRVVECSHCGHLTRMYPGGWTCPHCHENNTN